MSKAQSIRRTAGSFLLGTALVLCLSGIVSAAGGDLLWENRVPTSGNHKLYRSIVAGGQMVFAVGEVGTRADLGAQTPGDNMDAFVRAVDANTGTVVWEDRFDVGPSDVFGQVATDGDRVFVGGTVRTIFSFVTANFVVRAYDARSGRLLWQNIVDKGSGDFAHALVAQGGRVFVAGQVTNAAGNRDFYVRVMNGQTGEFLWQDQFELARGSERAFAMAVEGERVVVAGTRSSPFTGAPLRLIVRAYDVRTGTLLWNDVSFGANNFFVRNAALVIHGGLVFVGGTALNSSRTSFDFMVRAYDLDTGALRWQDVLERGGDPDTVLDLTVEGDRVFAVGQGGPGGIFNGDIIVRAYQATTGAVLWEDQFDVAGGDDNLTAVAAQGGRIVACGAVTNPQGNYDFFVRVYDARTGTVEWQDQVDVGDFDLGQALAIHGNRVFVAASFGDVPPGTNNAVIRAYRLK